MLNRVDHVHRDHHLQLADGLGTTHQLAGVNGYELVRYTYEPFGGLIYQTQTNPNPMKFAGEQHDDLENYYYLRARYYDPAIGRFISRDPLGGGGRSPYAYAGNNPVNATDPSGLCSVVSDETGCEDPCNCEGPGPGYPNLPPGYTIGSDGSIKTPEGGIVFVGPRDMEILVAIAGGLANGTIEGAAVYGLEYSSNPGWHVVKLPNLGISTQDIKNSVVGTTLIAAGGAILVGTLYIAPIVLTAEYGGCAAGDSPLACYAFVHTLFLTTIVIEFAAGTIGCGATIIAYGDCY